MSSSEFQSVHDEKRVVVMMSRYKVADIPFARRNRRYDAEEMEETHTIAMAKEEIQGEDQGEDLEDDSFLDVGE